VRIIQLIPQNQLGGLECLAYRVSSQLSSRGHEVLLLSNRDNGPLFDQNRPSNMQVRALNRRSRLDPRILPFLAGSIRHFDPQILHSHNFEANTWARTMGLFFPRVAVICHSHSGNTFFLPRHNVWIDRLLYRRCDGILVVNNELKSLLRDKHQAPPSKIHVLPNAIEVEYYKLPAGQPLREPLEVVCVASLTETKNHVSLLTAWRQVAVAFPQARLTLVGDGPLRGTLEKQAQEQNISDSIRFVGLQCDVRPFLWRASIFVLPSLREGMPMSLLEAMASGTACIATAVGGIPDLISDGITGRLVRPGDSSSLANTLLELLRCHEEVEQLGQRAQKKIAASFCLDRYVDRVEALYKKRLWEKIH